MENLPVLCFVVISGFALIGLTAFFSAKKPGRTGGRDSDYYTATESLTPKPYIDMVKKHTDKRGYIWQKPKHLRDFDNNLKVSVDDD